MATFEQDKKTPKSRVGHRRRRNVLYRVNDLEFFEHEDEAPPRKRTPKTEKAIDVITLSDSDDEPDQTPAPKEEKPERELVPLARFVIEAIECGDNDEETEVKPLENDKDGALLVNGESPEVPEVKPLPIKREIGNGTPAVLQPHVVPDIALEQALLPCPPVLEPLEPVPRHLMPSCYCTVCPYHHHQYSRPRHWNEFDSRPYDYTQMPYDYTQMPYDYTQMPYDYTQM